MDRDDGARVVVGLAGLFGLIFRAQQVHNTPNALGVWVEAFL